jgi:hypothetical protein
MMAKLALFTAQKKKRKEKKKTWPYYCSTEKGLTHLE